MNEHLDKKTKKQDLLIPVVSALLLLAVLTCCCWMTGENLAGLAEGFVEGLSEESEALAESWEELGEAWEELREEIGVWFPTETPCPTPADTPHPTVSEPTDAPAPTNTSESTYADPVVLVEIEGIGESVTDNFEWPRCQKAVFYWTAFSSSYGSASLIVHLHNAETGRDMSLVNEFAMDVPGGSVGGAVLQPLVGGEYYFVTENTDEAWALRVECQDGVAPVASGLDLQGSGNTVTDNYELPACSKSVFVWSAEPSNYGTASLIVHLCNAGEDRCPGLVNEFSMDLTGPLEGETLRALSGGIYFLAIDNTSGRPWSIRWECRD